MKKNKITIILTAALVSFVCGSLGAFLMMRVMGTTSEQVVKNVTTSQLVESSISSSVDKIYDATVAVVGYINGQEASTGTGFAYKNKGGYTYIMTNNHVVSESNNYEKIVVILSNGEEIESSLVGGETYSDIAILKIPQNDNLKICEIGDSSVINLGDTIFTVGTPMGKQYSGTVTKGILSGKNRKVEVSFSGATTDYYLNVLQIDAAINPGNSGGPLCNVSGEVIGINSLKLVQNEVEGMGFAIPIEDAMDYAEKIEKDGKVSRPFIGIMMTIPSDTYNLKKYNIRVDNSLKGVVVLEVTKGSPAERGKLETGDVITKFGGKEVTSIADLRYILYKQKVGDKVDVEYIRDGKTVKSTIKLEESEN